MFRNNHVIHLTDDIKQRIFFTTLTVARILSVQRKQRRGPALQRFLMLQYSVLLVLVFYATDALSCDFQSNYMYDRCAAFELKN